MAARKKPNPTLIERTPLAEWIAAALGLILTLTVIGYLIFDGLNVGDGPPGLSAAGGPAQAVAGGFVVPLVVRNDGDSTAAEVEVLATLAREGAVVEERRARFAYVAARGEAKGGVVFRTNPNGYDTLFSVQGYADP